MAITERDEIALQMHDRGKNPNIVHELTEEGFSELKKRLKELVLKEREINERSTDNFIRMLLGKPIKYLALRVDDLPIDTLRVLRRRSKYLSGIIALINSNIAVASHYEDNEDRVANLINDRARAEEELKQVLEELNLKINQK